ncbi:DUF3352 domain-containing protein [Chamaesiphon sp. OTE_8_metabat_110]|uniref:DUF3352 domain-containing protein n=1 Tax=Chamaesiphon sp. OTE_8_metabat_110 TaxID=2964696 RepID=UPI00286D6155|nr:DUF3352 domain-containing protein [Chamaesiphon sp. OTE_8_metabat_110]
MAKKSIITAVALVAAAGAGYAGYKYVYSGESNAGDLATVIPENALMVAYVSNEPETWAKLKKFGNPEAQKIVTAQIQEVKQQLLAQTQMDFDREVQPWLGNTMMAILPNAEAKSGTPRFLIAIGVKDKLKALDFANKLKAQSKEPTKEFDYKGIKITNSGTGSRETFSALVNDRLVLAPEKRSVEQAIDTANGQPSLANKAGNDWFRGDSLQLKQPIAAFYIPNYSQALQQMLASSKQPIPLDAATLAQLNKIQSVGGGIAIDDAGIRMKTIAKTDGTILSLPATSTKALGNFPADTFALFGGTGLNQIWTEANKIVATEPTAQQSLAQMRQSFTQSTQLDLDKDIFGWMGGEYTLGMMPVSTGIAAPLGFGGALAIDSTDRAITDNTMAKLSNMARGYGLSVESRQVGNTQMVDIGAPAGGGTILSYGWLNDKSLLLAMGDGLADKITTRSGESIDRSPGYTTALGSISGSKQSYAYIDVEKVFGLVNSKMGMYGSKSMPPDVNAIVTSIQGLGMSSTQPDKNTSQVEMLLALKPANK